MKQTDDLLTPPNPLIPAELLRSFPMGSAVSIDCDTPTAEYLSKIPHPIVVGYRVDGLIFVSDRGLASHIILCLQPRFIWVTANN